VSLRGKVIAIIGIGSNREQFEYHTEDVELLDIFAKQAAITIENDLLVRKVEQLEVKDALTGLYNESFIRDRLQEEIRRSAIYQRPCGLIILNIDNFQLFYKSVGSLQSESALKKIAMLILESISEVDRAGRIGDNEFAIVFPEKSKRQTQKVAEVINQKIEACFKDETDPVNKLTVSGGVSENPLDGMNAEELIAKARVSVGLAKAQGKNRILG
jgi:diguanylate cyclase (GGDEF)-like protein